MIKLDRGGRVPVRRHLVRLHARPATGTCRTSCRRAGTARRCAERVSSVTAGPPRARCPGPVREIRARIWQNGSLVSGTRPRPLTRARRQSTEQSSGPTPRCRSALTRSPPTPVRSQERANNVAVKIRLLRMGKIRNPQYRIVVADSRTKRDGRAIEYVGLYHPKEDPSRDRGQVRAGAVLAVGRRSAERGRAAPAGARPATGRSSRACRPRQPLKVAAERADRTAAYEAEAKAAAGLAEAEPAKKAAKAGQEGRQGRRGSEGRGSEPRPRQGRGRRPRPPRLPRPQAEEPAGAGADAQA